MDKHPCVLLDKLRTAAREAKAVILLDGLTNTLGRCGSRLLSDELARRLPAAHLSWGLYEPFSPDGTVETVQVIPYFFGMRPSDNPGRAGLELLMEGDLPDGMTSFLTSRTNDPTAALSMLRDRGAHARISSFSKDHKTVIAALPTSVSDRLAWLESPPCGGILSSTRISTPDPGWKTRHYSNHKWRIAGWCHGALLGAFDTLGMCAEGEQCLTKGVLPSPDTSRILRLRDTSTLASNLADSATSPVFYLKDCAYAARRGESKQKPIEFIATAIQKVWTAVSARYSNESAAILVISDHNSEIGIDQTLSGATRFGFITEDPLIWLHDASSDHALAQEDLVNSLRLWA